MWFSFFKRLIISFLFFLKYDPSILNMNTNKRSWWFSNNIGCLSPITPEYLLMAYERHLKNGDSIQIDDFLSVDDSTTTTTIPMLTEKIRHESLYSKKNYTAIDTFLNENCFLPFYWIEIIQCGILIFCSVISSYFFAVTLKWI